MIFSKEQPKVLVVGSCSIDLVLGTGVFPQVGETVMAVESNSFFGGKGANQAVGTSRLGASTYLIGCVGMDPKGQQVLRHLVDEGVNVGFVAESEEEPTGSAYVTTAEGQNTIVVVPSANHSLKAKHIANAEKFFSTADMVLVQLETTMETIEKTYELAKKYKVKLGIYAAPAVRLPLGIIDYASFIVAKQCDLPTIFGKDKDEVLPQFPNRLFVREDENTTVYHNGNGVVTYTGQSGEPFFKMGTGDGFTSGFAVALCHGNSVEDCVKLGSEVSLKVSEQRGSQKGLPTLKALGY